MPSHLIVHICAFVCQAVSHLRGVSYEQFVFPQSVGAGSIYCALCGIVCCSLSLMGAGKRAVVRELLAAYAVDVPAPVTPLVINAPHGKHLSVRRLAGHALFCYMLQVLVMRSA